MRRWILISAIIIFTFLIAACSSNSSYDTHGDLHFGSYQVYYKEHGLCEMYNIEIIDQDDEYSYYLGASGCEVTNYYFIKAAGKYVSIYEAIEKELISIDDVLDSNYRHIIIEEN